jgi:hypothetical protein
MILKKYIIEVFEQGEQKLSYADEATGFTEEEAIRKISKRFTGSESLRDSQYRDGRKYPLTFKAKEI